MTAFINFDIIIEDTGMGIPKDKIKDLFINFSKLDVHQKQNTNGIGLGLSICKDLIEQMGGSVNVESKEGVGSKFIV